MTEDDVYDKGAGTFAYMYVLLFVSGSRFVRQSCEHVLINAATMANVMHAHSMSHVPE